jgi:hypothetical protein
VDLLAGLALGTMLGMLMATLLRPRVDAAARAVRKKATDSAEALHDKGRSVSTKVLTAVAEGAHAVETSAVDARAAVRRTVPSHTLPPSP